MVKKNMEKIMKVSWIPDAKKMVLEWLWPVNNWAKCLGSLCWQIFQHHGWHLGWLKMNQKIR